MFFSKNIYILNALHAPCLFFFLSTVALVGQTKKLTPLKTAICSYLLKSYLLICSNYFRDLFEQITEIAHTKKMHGRLFN